MFYQLHTETKTTVATFNNLEKRDPSEIERPTVFENSRLGFIESVHEN